MQARMADIPIEIQLNAAFWGAAMATVVSAVIIGTSMMHARAARAGITLKPRTFTPSAATQNYGAAAGSAGAAAGAGTTAAVVPYYNPAFIVLPVYWRLMAVATVVFAGRAALLGLGPWPAVPDWYYPATFQQLPTADPTRHRREHEAVVPLVAVSQVFIYGFLYEFVAFWATLLLLQRWMSQRTIIRTGLLSFGAALVLVGLSTFAAVNKNHSLDALSQRLVGGLVWVLPSLFFFGVIVRLVQRRRGAILISAFFLVRHGVRIALLLEAWDVSIAQTSVDVLGDILCPICMFAAFSWDTHDWRRVGETPSQRTARHIADGRSRLEAVRRRHPQQAESDLVAADAEEPGLRTRLLVATPTDTVGRFLASSFAGQGRVEFATLATYEELARKTYWSVFRGTMSGQTVAIKEFYPPDFTEDDAALLLMETAICAQLRHPTIVQMFGISVAPPRVSLVFEYCGGGNLWTAIGSQWKNWDRARRYKLALQAAEAVAYLHSFQPPILHRDIKSANYVLTTAGTLKLTDFGLSRLIDQAAGVTTPMAIGTPQWMAPEIMTGSTPTERADVYSLGIVLWELFSGKRPFAGIKPLALCTAVVDQGLRPPMPEDMPGDLAALIQSCWNQEPAARPAAAAVVQALRGPVA